MDGGGEMAAMSPHAIDRLVLVSPAGLKPETGEIRDVFYYLRRFMGAPP
jgi:hypothetical protein